MITRWQIVIGVVGFIVAGALVAGLMRVLPKRETTELALDVWQCTQRSTDVTLIPQIVPGNGAVVLVPLFEDRCDRWERKE